MRGNTLINLVILAAALFLSYQVYSLGHDAISITGKAMTKALGVTR